MRRVSCGAGVAVTSTSKAAARPPHSKLGEPVEEFVPRTGEGQEPGATVVEAQGSAGERDAGEGDFIWTPSIFLADHALAAALQDGLRHFVSQVGGHGHAVAGVTEGEVEGVELTGVGHDVESEVERATPDVIDFGVAQLRVDREHASAQDFGAAANGAGGFRKEGGAAAEEHAAVGREPVVVEIIL